MKNECAVHLNSQPVLIGEWTLRRMTLTLCISFVVFHLQVAPAILAATNFKCKNCIYPAVPSFLISACFIIWCYAIGCEYLKLEADSGTIDHHGAEKYHLLLCLTLCMIAVLSICFSSTCWIKHCH